MDAFTRSQLLALSDAFYRAHAAAFDASRGHQAWPGWQRLLDWLPPTDARTNSPGNPILEVLDIGCGNGRFARFLHEAGFGLRYIGVDANEALLASARTRLSADLGDCCQLSLQNFLLSEQPGSALPSGPFDLIAVMGVLHHVPGRDWRLALLRAATERLARGGILALAAWQFADRERFVRRTVDWSTAGPVLDKPIHLAQLEAGDRLLRFGDDETTPPRYCHQVADLEFESWPEALGLEALADYRADGAEGDLNRYWILRRS
jgi:tRNA (uracil-5-)-methyltransferase TRM9